MPRVHTLALSTIAALLSPLAHSDSLTYSIYELRGEGRALLASGTVNSAAQDLEVRPNGRRAPPRYWESAVRIENGFHVGVLAKPGRASSGIGLWVRNDGSANGFSWDWFTHEKDDVFLKLQGPGRIRVRYTQEGGVAQMSSVEFLDDIELRFQQDMCRSKPGEMTHIVLVSKGSILSVASQQVAQANMWNAKRNPPPCPPRAVRLGK